MDKCLETASGAALRKPLAVLNKALLAWLAVMIFTACHQSDDKTVLRSAYYWSTTWESDTSQQQFLRDNDVQRIYLRYFDVVVDGNGEVMPNATVRFASPMPDSVEIIPTVFIVNDCLRKDITRLDQLLLKRILQISETHDVAGVKEIQIDCDWTKSTQETYFDMLSRLREAAHRHGLQLSVTIRLHQLSMKAPPVDRGILMFYNTSDIHNFEKNPILDLEDAGPYLRHLADYPLPLSTAYPAFAWRLLVRGNHLRGIMHGDDDLTVLPGDTILHREVPLSTVLEAKTAVGKRRSDANNEVIIFDISSQNIQRIQQYHYEKIYYH